MLLTITMTGPDAAGLGFLLHKHPDRVQKFSLPVGEATVFYPESMAERVTAALLLEIDPISMVRRRLKTREGLSLTDYVTDRPYAASSMLAVALGRVFTTALNGRCDSRPELAATQLPLVLRVPAVPARGGDALVRALFEPLGWEAQTSTAPFGPNGEWGDAPYVDLTLTGTVRLADALSQLYVLLPVLDNAKHYWASSDEVDKLVRRGEGWLAEHPQRELIVRRYLRARRSFIEDATARLNALDDVVEPEEADDDRTDDDPTAAEQRTPLRVHRLEAVMAAVREVGARRVVDLGCGEGYYLRALIEEPSVTEIVGIDVSPRVLEYAERKLNLDRRPDKQRDKLTLRQSSVTYRDDAIERFDAVLLIEVIEHLEPDRIASLESSVFGAARPKHVILTTPNRECNSIYELADGQWRHPDHRFEWTRVELEAWATRVADEHGYRVAFRTVGDVDPELGAPTQLALFTDARTQEPAHD
ncbi:MAG: 3' terminal RNA ribose 2'-O-methyltransferase Hen1 [Tessaracoccus sp.]|uniref:3' terminal RNA ribose 2'-O-methyltransferase Hen1 n=1 Tax=Tessaracoccus sp. TaxID=1971211 RepID=UPI001EB29AD4|nr:3' terminal RNA ribose 2'-O-methyltransferase Hen1 [Tessaracoccus sp.]MBK7820384.1 3' terminal RNA ribose 2'-O-methyltransferase Hen1 [Tessaracoccus sp.]